MRHPCCRDVKQFGFSKTPVKEYKWLCFINKVKIQQITSPDCPSFLEKMLSG